MTTKNKREPVHFERAEGVDPDKFADELGEKVADEVIAQVNRQRKAAGKPPLKGK
jgi:hypothetical protein